MNRKLPYEKRIAEKMRHLQLPGKEILWQQMKAKLDREMPLPEKGEKGGGSKWWWLGSIIVIISGIWVVTNTTDKSVAHSNKENTELISPESPNTIDYTAASEPGMNIIEKNSIDQTPGDNIKSVTESDINKKAQAILINDKTGQNSNKKKSAVLNSKDNPFAAVSYSHKNNAAIDPDSTQDHESGRPQLNTLTAIANHPQKTS